MTITKRQLIERIARELHPYWFDEESTRLITRADHIKVNQDAYRKQARRVLAAIEAAGLKIVRDDSAKSGPASPYYPEFVDPPPR